MNREELFTSARPVLCLPYWGYVGMLHGEPSYGIPFAFDPLADSWFYVLCSIVGVDGCFERIRCLWMYVYTIARVFVPYCLRRSCRARVVLCVSVAAVVYAIYALVA